MCMFLCFLEILNMKAPKHTCFHENFPFSAYFFPHHMITVKVYSNLETPFSLQHRPTGPSCLTMHYCCPSRVTIMENAIDNIPQLWSVMESAPHTLVHNDCNPRNICLRKPGTPITLSTGDPATQRRSTFTPYSSDITMCMYDWELATIGVPQHDLAEFLAFSLQPNCPLQSRLEFIDFYRQHLQHYSGMEFPNERYVHRMCGSNMQHAPY